MGIYGALDIEKMRRLIDSSQHYDNFVDGRTRNGSRSEDDGNRGCNPSTPPPPPRPISHMVDDDDDDHHKKEQEKNHDNEPSNLPSLGKELQLLHKKGVRGSYIQYSPHRHHHHH